MSIWHESELEQVSCDFCHSSQNRVWFQRPDGLNVVRCVECSLTFINPRPKAHLVERMYSADYFTGRQASAQGVGFIHDYASGASRKNLRGLARKSLQVLRSHVKVRRRHMLEIGCATGEFVAEAASAGAYVEGFDISADVIEMAKQRYPRQAFTAGTVDKLVGRPGIYNAICAFEVVEHLLSVEDFFAKVTPLLRPGGVLFLSTPNVELAEVIGPESWIGFTTSLEHLYFLSAPTLAKYIHRHGLVLETWYTVSRHRIPRPLGPFGRLVRRFSPGGDTGVDALLSDFVQNGRGHQIFVVARKPYA